ncbi:hypothetical protein ANN_10012 [Periplaneta americana]|uniref:Uncharacterized protein n=1 Tax=Periplaneta americana TaxID=6978 RepID=A0ABQ8TN71_PERAM|nr:hypothetical protein ANN_10012 [Periplaneta americana]
MTSEWADSISARVYYGLHRLTAAKGMSDALLNKMNDESDIVLLYKGQVEIGNGTKMHKLEFQKKKGRPLMYKVSYWIMYKVLLLISKLSVMVTTVIRGKKFALAPRNEPGLWFYVPSALTMSYAEVQSTEPYIMSNLKSGHKAKNTRGGEFDPVIWIDLRRSLVIFALLVLLAAVFCTMSAPQQPPSAGDQKNKDGSVNMRFFPGSYPGVVAGSYPGAYPGGYIGGIPSYYGGVPPVLPGGFPPVYQGNYPAVAPGIPAYPGVYGRPFVHNIQWEGVIQVYRYFTTRTVTAETTQAGSSAAHA